LKTTLAKLNSVKRPTLQYACDLLSRISAHEADNKMTAINLAMCIGPDLLRPTVDSLESALQIPQANEALAEIIAHYDELFTTRLISSAPPSPSLTTHEPVDEYNMPACGITLDSSGDYYSMMSESLASDTSSALEGSIAISFSSTDSEYTASYNTAPAAVATPGPTTPPAVAPLPPVTSPARPVVPPKPPPRRFDAANPPTTSTTTTTSDKSPTAHHTRNPSWSATASTVKRAGVRIQTREL
jgi:hypothetical protein